MTSPEAARDRETSGAGRRGGSGHRGRRRPWGAAVPRALVIDDVRVVDGRGGPAIEAGRVVVRGDRIEAVGAAATTPAPADAERVSAAGATVLPGLVDLHFHIEEDPKLALRQLAHGVTAFRDPGEWFEKFDGLAAMIRADGLPGPRMFLCGPHIDGEQPAYPEDAVVARDPEEARRHAERAIDAGRDGDQDLLPPAAGVGACGHRRVPGPWRALHGPPGAARRAGAPERRAARRRAHHVVRRVARAGDPCRALPAGGPEGQPGQERRALRALRGGGSRRPRGACALRRRAGHAPVRGRDAGRLRGPGGRPGPQGQRARRADARPRLRRDEGPDPSPACRRCPPRRRRAHERAPCRPRARRPGARWSSSSRPVSRRPRRSSPRRATAPRSSAATRLGELAPGRSADLVDRRRPARYPHQRRPPRLPRHGGGEVGSA